MQGTWQAGVTVILLGQVLKAAPSEPVQWSVCGAFSPRSVQIGMMAPGYGTLGTGWEMPISGYLSKWATTCFVVVASTPATLLMDSVNLILNAAVSLQDSVAG